MNKECFFLAYHQMMAYKISLDINEMNNMLQRVEFSKIGLLIALFAGWLENSDKNA